MTYHCETMVRNPSIVGFPSRGMLNGEWGASSLGWGPDAWKSGQNCIKNDDPSHKWLEKIRMTQIVNRVKKTKLHKLMGGEVVLLSRVGSVMQRR